MKLILVTGGARSGKSDWAVRYAQSLSSGPVTFVATAEASDEDMTRRIRRHRAERPSSWTTVEEPRNVADAIRHSASEIVVLDCVTLWVSNLIIEMQQPGEEDVVRRMLHEVDRLCEALSSRGGTLIAVTNEVGLGIVPATPLGRWFRDSLGCVNRRLAADAARVVLMLAGLELVMKEEAPGTHSW